MISLKELKYVDTWAKSAPYPGKKYAMETLENMKILFDTYNKNYRGKDYSIIFSDSSEIEFEILDSNICHMLGIDYKNLMSGNYDVFLKDVLNIDRNNTKVKSYDVVKRIIENYEEIIRYDEKSQNRALNYYKSRIKCEIFDKISDFEKFNFGKLDTQDESKLLFMASNEAICPYFLIRLNKDSGQLKHGVTSLLAPESSKVKLFFDGFSSSIPTQILIDDNQKLNKIEASPKEKIDLLNSYKSILATYSIDNKMDISGDYLSVLADLENNQKKKTLQ